MEVHVSDSLIVSLVSSAASGLIAYMITNDTVLAAISAFTPLILIFIMPKTISEPLELGLLVLGGVAVAYIFKYAKEKMHEKKTSETQQHDINKKLDAMLEEIKKLETELNQTKETFSEYLLQLENKIDKYYKNLNGGIWQIIGLFSKSKQLKSL